MVRRLPVKETNAGSIPATAASNGIHKAADGIGGELRVDNPSAIGDRLAVGRLALTQETEVRFLLPELAPYFKMQISKCRLMI
jgi:hypothetical protein